MTCNLITHSIFNSYKTLKLLLVVSISPLLWLGCLSESSAPTKGKNSVSITDFSGAVSVKNLNGPMKVEWTRSTSPSIKGYNIYYQMPDGTFDLIGNVGADISSFIHGSSGSVSSSFIGKIHTYRVRAVDLENLEDSNQKNVSQISYSGIISARALSRTSVEVTLPTVSASFDSIRIYAYAPSLNEVPTLVASLGPGQTTATVSNLKSGITYNFYAQAYSSYLDSEDGNTAFTNTQTNSLTSEGYLGVYNVQAFGAAPDAPDFQARQQLAIISWVNFSNGGSGTRYRVIRTPKDAFIYTNPKLTNGSLDFCTPNSTKSCIVQGCDGVPHSTDGSLGPTCLDTQVAAAPAVYDYSIVAVQGSGASEYAEEIGLGNQDLYRVRVHIPPENMALVQRDAANYEMCQLLHSENMPLEKQRCAFTGYGSAPLNSGPGNDPLGLSPNYYDFGYNLFVDRWELGCDYDEVITASAALTDSDATSYEGKVVMTAANVRTAAWPSFPSICRLARNGKWYGTTATTSTSPTAIYRNFQEILSDPQVKKLFTNNPKTRSNRKAVAMNFELTQAWDACQTQEDQAYGKKRLPRMREFRVFSAFPWMPGEKHYDGTSLINAAMNSTQMQTRLYPSSAGQVGGSSFNTRGCGTYGSTSVANGDSPVPPDASSLLTDLQDFNSKNRWPSWASGIYPVSYSYAFIGSNNTSGCVTRYGIQDTAGHQKEYVSDKIGECNPRPIASTYTTTFNQCFTNLDSQRCTGYTLDFARETGAEWVSGTTGYNCSLVAPGVPGNCPAATTALPSTYIKYCTGTGGGLDSGNVDLSPYAINALLPPYSYRVTNVTRKWDSLGIRDKVSFGSYFNPALGIPTYDTSASYTYTAAYGATSDFTKIFDATPGDMILVDYISNATVNGSSPVSLIGTNETIILGNRGYSAQNEHNGTNYARRIAVGGGITGTAAGRWQTEILFAPNNPANYNFEDWGARCVLPAE